MKGQAKETDKSFQVVKFRVDRVPFSVDIGKVREIIYYRKAMPMPDAPAFIEGVLDLRGTVIPVIDLRKRLGIEGTAGARPDHILILRLDGASVGLVVDEVTEVLRVQEGDIQSPHRVHKGPGRRYVSGVVKRGSEMIFLLDLDRLLTSDEMASISEIKT